MSKYRDSYIASRDIDWFLKLNGIPIHVASFGGMLPEKVNDKEYLTDMQQRIANLDEMVGMEIGINEDYVNSLFANNENPQQSIERYLRSFAGFAKKGFFSYDKFNLNDPQDARYILIAWPDITNPKLEELDFRLNIKCPPYYHSRDWLDIRYICWLGSKLDL